MGEEIMCSKSDKTVNGRFISRLGTILIQVIKSYENPNQTAIKPVLEVAIK